MSKLLFELMWLIILMFMYNFVHVSFFSRNKPTLLTIVPLCTVCQSYVDWRPWNLKVWEPLLHHHITSLPPTLTTAAAVWNWARWPNVNNNTVAVVIGKRNNTYTCKVSEYVILRLRYVTSWFWLHYRPCRAPFINRAWISFTGE